MLAIVAGNRSGKSWQMAQFYTRVVCQWFCRSIWCLPHWYLLYRRSAERATMKLRSGKNPTEKKCYVTDVEDFMWNEIFLLTLRFLSPSMSSIQYSNEFGPTSAFERSMIRSGYLCVNSSQTPSPRPLRFQAPSVWYAELATPNRKSSGNFLVSFASNFGWWRVCCSCSAELK